MLLMPLVPHTNHMINQHPITPPTELVSMWRDLLASRSEEDVLIFATQWGADQELEACCKWLPKLPPWSADDLRRHRRPKPPSLKQQALNELQVIRKTFAHQGLGNKTPALDAALKRLGELEALDD
jgi:hypothetical protein